MKPELCSCIWSASRSNSRETGGGRLTWNNGDPKRKCLWSSVAEVAGAFTKMANYRSRSRPSKSSQVGVIGSFEQQRCSTAYRVVFLSVVSLLFVTLLSGCGGTVEVPVSSPDNPNLVQSSGVSQVQGRIQNVALVGQSIAIVSSGDASGKVQDVSSFIP